MRRPLAYARGAVTDYSHRRAIIGSTFAARRAGSQQATSATPMSSVATMINVSGSVALTLNSKFDMRRVSANAPIKPITTPVIFFFFQAEDGIRDFHVTGVQTCALPIYLVEGGVPADPLILAVDE